MKMAKASKADMEMALKLCSALEAIDRRFFPEGAEGENECADFDMDDDEHCGTVLRHLYDILQGGSVVRVIWGMYVLMDPDNKLIDPDADCLELHPALQAAQQDAERLEWLMRNVSAAEWERLGVTHDGGNDGRARIDAAMAMPANVELRRGREDVSTESGGCCPSPRTEG